MYYFFRHYCRNIKIYIIRNGGSSPATWLKQNLCLLLSSKKCLQDPCVLPVFCCYNLGKHHTMLNERPSRLLLPCEILWFLFWETPPPSAFMWFIDSLSMMLRKKSPKSAEVCYQSYIWAEIGCNLDRQPQEMTRVMVQGKISRLRTLILQQHTKIQIAIWTWL